MYKSHAWVIDVFVVCWIGVCKRWCPLHMVPSAHICIQAMALVGCIIRGFGVEYI